MATDGYFEITGTYDEDAGHFLDEDGNQSFTLNDEHGTADVREFSLAVADERLLKVWKATRAAADLEQEIDEGSLRIRVPMNVIDCKPESAMDPRYGVAVVTSDGVTFEAQDKHRPITVETRGIDLSEIEAHLVAAGLIERSECRSDVAAGSPAP